MQDSLMLKAVHAISKATGYSLEIVQRDGHWNGELLSNATITAEYVFLLQSIGSNLSRDRDALRHYLLSVQQVDGSWAIAPNFPGDVSTTTEAYLALKILGLEEGHEQMSLARHFVLSRGGIAKVRVFTRFYLAMFGLFPWNAVPQMPPELIFLTSNLPINIYVLSSWARSTVVPLSIIRAHEVIYALPNGKSSDNHLLDELWCEPSKKHVTYNMRASNDLTASIFVAIDTLIHYTRGMKYNPLRPYARRQCVEWILSRQEKTGDWAGIFPPMHFGVLALLLEGFSLQDEPVRKGLEAIERFAWEDQNGKRIQSCVSPVWDTVLMTIGLCDAGMLRDDENLRRAIDWVKQRQLLGQEGDWRVYNPRLAPGGFSFEYNNTWYPDVDDTAAAILAFLKQDPKSISSAPVVSAVTWTLGMQNRDGGFAAFDLNNNKFYLNKIPFSDMNSLCDPSTADVTGRVVEAFGLMLQIAIYNDIVSNSLVARIRTASARAIVYLAETQEPSGAWYGRWGSNYIYGTSNVLCGLSYFSYGNTAVQNMMRRGARWIESVQSTDGGWGESLHSYRNVEKYAGRGLTSTPSQTAWALMALLACAKTPNEHIKRGVSYLIQTQTDVSGTGNGASWSEQEYTGTGFPNFFYLGYTLYRHYFVMMALGRYVALEQSAAEEKSHGKIVRMNVLRNLNSKLFDHKSLQSLPCSLSIGLPRPVTSIDRRKCHRIVPMRILALGLCRTGTESLRKALQILGFNDTYHGFAACLENPRDCEMWLDAMRAKFDGKGRKFRRAEFDQLLGHCQATTDVPAVCFAPELIKAYPEAKVILTVRDVDDWHRSALKTLVTPCYGGRAVIASFLTVLFRSDTRWARPVMLRVWEDYFCGFEVNGKHVFTQHNTMVRNLVPPKNLLEYRVGEDGWGPLCNFLDVPVPEGVSFPNSNTKQEIAERIRLVANRELKNAASKLFWMFFVPLIVSFSVTMHVFGSVLPFIFGLKQ